MTIRSLSIAWILTAAAFLFSGCAVGNVFSFAEVAVALLAATGGKLVLSIAIADRRERVQKGTKQPSFAGTFRGGFGNPFNVSTKDNEPLADVFSKIVAAGLQAKGFSPTSVPVRVNTPEPEIIKQLSSSGSDKALLINIDKWHSDTMTNVGMHYLLEAKVLDSDGNVIAQNSITGEQDGKDNLRGSVMNPPAYAKKVVPVALGEHIERLLNHDDIVKALSS